MKIGFATTNPYKLKETRECLTTLDPKIEVVALTPGDTVEETGQTFCENALIKLHACLSQGVPVDITHVISEDAGLIVEALDGRFGLSPFPGVCSDRWFTTEVQETLFGQVFPSASYVEKNQALLKLMEGVSNRNARYEACIACWDRSSDTIFTETGTVALKVAQFPSGKNGFGYDPIMIPYEMDPVRTMAELSAEEKNRISHRFQALSQVYRHLATLKAMVETPSGHS